MDSRPLFQFSQAPPRRFLASQSIRERRMPVQSHRTDSAGVPALPSPGSHERTRHISMNILGIATPGPNAAVALFDNHSVLAAIEEEKLSRSNDQHALPQLALARVLSSAGMQLADVDAIALSDRNSTKQNRRKNSGTESTVAHFRQLLAGRRFS